MQYAHISDTKWFSKDRVIRPKSDEAFLGQRSQFVEAFICVKPQSKTRCKVVPCNIGSLDSLGGSVWQYPQPAHGHNTGPMFCAELEVVYVQTSAVTDYESLYKHDNLGIKLLGEGLLLGFKVCTMLPFFFKLASCFNIFPFAPNVWSSSDAYDRVKNACFCVFRDVCACCHLVNLSSWASPP